MKQVIIISGIGQGMGREVALLLAANGHTICGFDMDKESIASLQKELESRQTETLLESFDITDKVKLKAFTEKVLKKHPRVDTVLSNVGIGFFGAFEELDLDRALKCLDINIIGCARLLQGFIPSMRENRHGKLVVMSSLVGRIPFPFESMYSASKFAIEGMVESLQYELKPFNIKTALVEPAQVSTEFAAKIHKLPAEDSPYYDRTRRFIERDQQLIKTATSPQQAARRIAAVVEDKNPPLHNQVDFMSTFFLFLNRVLPKKIRDMILINHMNIKV